MDLLHVISYIRIIPRLPLAALRLAFLPQIYCYRLCRHCSVVSRCSAARSHTMNLAAISGYYPLEQVTFP